LELRDLVNQSYYYTNKGMLFQGDTIEWMSKLPDNSIDMILADLPYGKLAHKWDSIIPMESLWNQYKRIIKNNGAIVLFGIQPFTSMIIGTNLEMFKYTWVWDKGKAGNVFTAKLKPLQTHEDIIVFSKGAAANGSKKNMKYFPQMEQMNKPRKYKIYNQGESFYRNSTRSIEYVTDKKYPKSILYFPNTDQKNKVHPTQKPVALFEYLIRTYTNENEIVLDNTSGSGTTAIAAENTNRRWICIEKEIKYCDITVDRLKNLHSEVN
jgi:site-specific DNA-methyltransferase (adenine-specific)